MPFLLPPQFSSRDLFPAFPHGTLCNPSQAGSLINSKKTFCHTIVYLSLLFPNTTIRMFVRESLIVLCHVSLPGKRKTLSEESTFAYFSLWLLVLIDFSKSSSPPPPCLTFLLVNDCDVEEVQPASTKGVKGP